MSLAELRDMRSFVSLVEKEGDLLRIKKEVNPIVEMSAISKKMDGGPAVLFENVKGYPHAVTIQNHAEKRKVAKAMGVSIKDIKFKCFEAYKRPIPAKTVEWGACQEVTITKDVDVTATLPLAQQTELESMPALGSGITLLSGKYFDGGSHMGYHRMHFRGKNWGSIQFAPGSHMDQVISMVIKDKVKIPITVNICPSMACQLVAGAGFLYTMMPKGHDELGVAGGLEGAPIELVKARTLDALAIANSEWVIEGYVCTGDRVWETEAAEKAGRQGEAFIHPEWTGYQGRAYRAFKFEVTAITHRKDKPIFHAPIVSGTADTDLCRHFREAGFLHVAEAVRPGLVVDVNILRGIPVWGGIVFQVKKTWRREEGFQRNVLAAALGLSQGLKLAIAVDDDVDIYNADDVLWAISSRANPVTGIWVGAGGKGQTLQPGERGNVSAGQVETGAETAFLGGLAIDATVPFEQKRLFKRAQYAVDKVDLKDWLSAADITKAESLMSSYERQVTGKRGI